MLFMPQDVSSNT